MNYYFDLDGVLMQFERDAYSGDDPQWLKKNAHYYRNLEPDNYALQLIYDLIGYIKTHRDTHGNDKVYILTAVMQGKMFNEHFHDKILRTMELIPQLPLENILISVGDKNDCAEFVTDHTLTKEDVLIDDYNPNLEKWRAAGGLAIKYCNGQNNPASYSGPSIGPEFNMVTDTVNYLLRL